MDTIKIHCGCGQHYAFEVGAGGQMPPNVTCPACGARSTDAANTIVVPSSAPRVAAASAPTVRVHVPTPVAAPPAPVPGRPAARTGPADPAQSEIEARAKIIWGDPAEEVVKYLMIQGYKPEAATDLVRVLFKERETSLRWMGIKKMLIGFPMMLLPVLEYIHFVHIGAAHATTRQAKALGFTIVLGLVGLGIFVNGLLTLLFPKSEPGDIADM